MARVTLITSGSSAVLKNKFCEINVNLADGTWSGRNRANDIWFFRNARFTVDHGLGSQWQEPKTSITWRKRELKSCFGDGLELTITSTPVEGYFPVRMLMIRLYPDHSFIEIGWGVRNRFSYPIRIRDIAVLNGGELFEGQTVKQPRVLKSGAGAEPNTVTSGRDVDAFNGALLTYKNGETRHSMVAGGLHYSEYGRRVQLVDSRKQPKRKIKKRVKNSMSLTVWDPQGKLVRPGKTYLSPDTCYLDFVTSDPFEALESYGIALRMANAANPNTYDFPTLCGWMVSTKHLGEGAPINNSTGLVEQARIAKERGLLNYTPLAVRLEPDTYCYGNQGDTQQGWWDNAHWAEYGPGNGHEKGTGNGSLRKPYETFAKFCKAVSDLGCVPFTYFQSSMPSNDFAVAHPDWMLNKDISLLHVTHAHHRPMVRYDYTNPGFRAHCLRVWKSLRKAGLNGVKFDYPETAWAKDGGFDDLSFTTTSAYRELYRLCREGLGKDAYLHERNLGGTTHESAPRLDATAGIVDIQRVWGDASHFEPEMASRMGLRWYKSRSVFLYYPDGKSFFMNGKELPAYKRRAFLSLIAFLSGRLEIGTSIGSMTDDMFHDVTRLYPVLGGTKSPRPVDMLTGGAHPEVYVYDVSPAWSQVLLVNNNKRGKKNISAPLSGDQAETGSLGLEPHETYHAFEFWQQRYLGQIKGNKALSLELRAGEVAMVSVRKVEDHPQPISTNRHIMQGMMECHGVRWSAKQKVLSGSVDVVGGEEFILTIACNGAQPTTCEGATVRRRTGNTGIVDLAFSTRKSCKSRFALHFA